MCYFIRGRDGTNALIFAAALPLRAVLFADFEEFGRYVSGQQQLERLRRFVFDVLFERRCRCQNLLSGLVR